MKSTLNCFTTGFGGAWGLVTLLVFKTSVSWLCAGMGGFDSYTPPPYNLFMTNNIAPIAIPQS
jgi:hypothetical protein